MQPNDAGWRKKRRDWSEAPPEFVLLESGAAAGSGPVARLFVEPERVFVTRRPEEVAGLLAAMDQALAAARRAGRPRWLAGYLAYEALDGARDAEGRRLSYSALLEPDPRPVKQDPGPLLWFGLFPAPREFNAAELAAFLEPDDRGYSLREPAGAAAERAERRRVYPEEIARIRAEIGAGRVYQSNHCELMRFECSGDPRALYARLRAQQPTAYGALLRIQSQGDPTGGAGPSGERWAISCSPELFFEVAAPRPAKSRAAFREAELREAIIRTRPMKGTAPRSADPARDEELRQALRSDPKTRAENWMIVDLLRNDLGAVAKPGSVRVLRSLEVESHPTLHQMTSLIEARYAPDADASQASGEFAIFQKLIPALFPCGSVTGAPRLAARRLIRALEPEPRGIYTGAIGCVASHPAEGGGMLARFNVAIRTLELAFESDSAPGDDRASGMRRGRGEARYGAGGGIVWDSEAAAERRELELKASFLRPALDGFAIFETMLLDSERGIVCRAEHAERMQRAARSFAFPLPAGSLAGRLDDLEREAVRNEPREAASQGEQEPASRFRRVRLLLRRDGSLEAETQPWPQGLERLGRAARGLRLTLAGPRIWSRDPFRAHKTTERSLYDAGLAAARAAGYDDLLFCNERDRVVETAICNLLVWDRRGRRWLTPDPEEGALPGVLLAALRKGLRRPERLAAASFTLEEARELGPWFAVNSLRGLQRVLVFDPRPLAF